jgi:hyperosmotically inducible periplasmic protein
MNLSKQMLLAVQAAAVVALIAGIGTPSALAGSSGIHIATGDKPDREGSTAERSGAAVDDSVVTAKVKSALVADSAVKAHDINVKTRKGEVVLSGNVDNEAQIDRAVQIVSNVDGVKSVSNRLSVKK